MTPPPEVVIVNLVWYSGWVAGVVLLLALEGGRSPHLASFRRRMLAQWPPAIVLAALTFLGLAALAFLGLAALTFLGLAALTFLGLAARDVAEAAVTPGALAGDLLLPAGVFAQTLIGFALARGIPKFDPLPLATAFASRTRILRTLLLTALVTA